MKPQSIAPQLRRSIQNANTSLLEEVLAGLRERPKRLHPKFFYDARGSALFDRICELPEYYLTRTETAILKARAPEFVRAQGSDLRVIELGSGASVKTRILLDAIKTPATYVPIDISRSHLMAAAHNLSQRYPNIDVMPVCADFSQPAALTRLYAMRPQRTLVFFPGSTIGNFSREEAVDLLRLMAKLAGEDGAVVVGADLRKDRSILERAYDDTAGITAAFNRNILSRLNEEFGADFDLSAFEHRAPWVEAESRIEMHLVCRQGHTVRLGRESVDIATDEIIWTESCHKYDSEGFAAMALEAGLAVDDVWIDEQKLFSVQVLKKSGAVH